MSWFLWGPHCPQSLVTERDEAIKEAGKGTLHSVGKSRKQVQENREERGGRKKRKITGRLWEFGGLRGLAEMRGEGKGGKKKGEEPTDRGNA